MGIRGGNASLFLQIGGSADGLVGASKAGRTALLNLGSAANDVATEVEKAFADLGKTTVDNGLRDLERNFQRTFDTIKRNAQSALSAPGNAGAAQILGAAGAEQSAQAAARQATQLRALADAAARVSERAGDAGKAEQVLATVLEAQAVEAGRSAAALRTQADLLGKIATEAKIAGDADEDAMNRVVKGSGKAAIAKAELQHVLRSAGDSFAAGLPPTQIFSLELGRIAEAMAFYGQSLGEGGKESKDFASSTGEAAKGALETGKTVAEAGEHVKGFGGKLAAVGEFLGGPWGLLLTGAIAVAAPFVAKILEGSDALGDELKKLQENADKTAIADAAKAAFARTQDGLIAATRELTRELDKQNESLRSNAERQNIAARSTLGELQTRRPALAKNLADAQARLQQTSSVDTTTVEGATSRIDAQRAFDAAKQDLATLDAAINAANVGYQRTRVDLAAEEAKRDADPMARINKAYDERIRLARAAADAAAREGREIGAATKAKLTAIEAERKAALKAEQDRQSAANRKPNENQIGRVIDVAEATRIAASIGGRVTSGYRSHEDQERIYADKLAGRHAGPVAKPGSSDHERGQAIDIAYGPGISVATIRAAFEKQGVQIRQLLDEPAQKVFHVGFGPKGKAGPSAETIAKREQAEKDKATRDAEAYAQLLDRAQQDGLQLSRGRNEGIRQSADLAVQSVDIERQRLVSAAQAGVAERRWTQAQADALVTQYGINAQLKTATIRRDEASKLLDQQFTADQHDRDARDQLLQIGADLATTRKERLAIEQQLLADRQAERRASLDHTIADPNATPEAVDQAKIDKKRLPDLENAERGSLAAQNRDPLGAYRDELTRNVGDMNDALKGVEVDGLKGVEDGISGLISGTETAAQAFKRMASSIISDLVRIGAEKLILSFIGLKTGGLVPGFAGGGLPGFAGGGDPGVDRGIIRGPGTGTSDSILAMVGRKPIKVSAGEGIVNARGVRKHWPLVQAINDDKLPAFATGGLVDPGSIYMRSLPPAAAIAPRMGGGAPITFDFRGAVVTEDLLRQANAISARQAMGAVIASTEQAKQDRADFAMSQIP